MWIRKGDKFSGVVEDKASGLMLGMKAKVDDEAKRIIIRKLWEYFEDGKLLLKWNRRTRQLETIPTVTELLKREYGSLKNAFRVLKE